MAKQTIQIGLDFTANTSKAKSALKDLSSNLSSLMGVGADGEKLSAPIKKAQGEAAKLMVAMQQAVNVDTGKFDLSKFNNSLKRSGTSLQQLRNSLVAAGPEGTKTFMALANSIVAAEVPTKRINASLAKMLKTLKDTARWQISSSIVHGLYGALQSAYGYAQNLNKSLNDIRIVTGYNTEYMEKFAAEANKAARSLSTTTNEYAKASLIYFQQGLTDAEVARRTETTIKMANVTGEVAEEVSSYMTAIWNNFDNGTKSLEYYADAVTALGAATASSSEEIATGLQKFSAVASTVGLSYEYATAALATVTSETRESAETVGTAFKTIFARLESLSLGETLDDDTTMTKYSQALAAVGVNIKNANGQLKDMDTIIDEVGQKWNQIGKDQQIALAQTVAGMRQYNNFIALMDNYEDFKVNVELAESAEGTLNEQAEIYAESWEAARDRVQAAAESIYEKLLDDDFFIDILNGFEKMITFVDKLIDSVGGLEGVLSGVSAIVLKVFSEQAARGLENMVYNLKSFVGLGAAEVFNTKQRAAELVKEIAPSGEGDSPTTKATYSGFQARIEAQLEYANKEKELTEAQTLAYQYQIQVLDELITKRIAAAQAEEKAENQSGEIVKDAYVQERAVANIKASSPQEKDFRTKWTEDISLFKGTEQNIAAFDRLVEQLANSTADGYKEAKKEFDNFIKSLDQDTSKAAEKIKAAAAKINAPGEGNKKSSRKQKQEKAKNWLESGEKRDWQKSNEQSFADKRKNATGNKPLDENRVKAFENVAEAIREEVSAKLESAEADKKVQEQNENIIDGLNKKNEATKDYYKTFVNAAQVVSSLTFALSSAESAIEAVKNPNLSGWEKFQQVMISLSTILPMLMSAWSSLNEIQGVSNALGIAGAIIQARRYGLDIKSLANDQLKIANTLIKNKATDEEIRKTLESNFAHALEEKGVSKNSAAKMAAALASKVLGKAKQGETTSVWANNVAWYASPITWIAAVIIAVVAAVVALAIAMDKLNGALGAANENYSSAIALSESLKTRLDEAKASAEDLKETLEGYDSAIEKMEGLVKGTKEYNEVVQEANDQARKLIENYGLRYKFDAATGLLEINPEDLANIEQKTTAAVRDAQADYIGSQSIVSEAERQKKIADAAVITGKGSDAMTGIGGFFEKLGKGYVQSGAYFGPIGAFVQGINQGIAVGKQTNNVGSGILAGLANFLLPGTSGWVREYYDKETEIDRAGILNTLFSEYEQNGKDFNSALATLTETEKEMIKSLGKTDEELMALCEGLARNTKAQLENNKQILSTKFSGNASYLVSDSKNIITTLAAQDFTAEQERQKNKLESRTSEERAKEYARQMGYDPTNITQENGQFVFFDATGKEQARLNDTTITTSLAQQFAADYIANNIGTYLSKAHKITADFKDALPKNVEMTAVEIDEFIANALSGEITDLGYLTEAELEKLKNLDFTTILGQDLNSEQLKAIADSISETQGKYTKLIEAQSKEAQVFSSQFENIAIQNREALGRTFDYAKGSGFGDEWSNFVTELIKGNEEQANQIIQIVDSVDWTKGYGALIEFHNILEDNNIEIDTSKESWVQLNEVMKKAPIAAVHLGLSTIREELATIADITKDIQFGDIISDEDYNTLRKYIAGIDEMFILTKDGYQFIGNEGTFADLATEGTELRLLSALTGNAAARLLATELGETDFATFADLDVLNTTGALTHIQWAANNKLPITKENYAQFGFNSYEEYEKAVEAAKSQYETKKVTITNEDGSTTEQDVEVEKEITPEQLEAAKKLQNAFSIAATIQTKMAAGEYDDSKLLELEFSQKGNEEELKELYETLMTAAGDDLKLQGQINTAYQKALLSLKAYGENIDVYQDEEAALERVNKKLNENAKARERAFDIKDKIALLKEETELLKKQVAINAEIIKQSKQERAEALEKLKSYGVDVELDKDGNILNAEAIQKSNRNVIGALEEYNNAQEKYTTAFDNIKESIYSIENPAELEYYMADEAITEAKKLAAEKQKSGEWTREEARAYVDAAYEAREYAEEQIVYLQEKLDYELSQIDAYQNEEAALEHINTLLDDQNEKLEKISGNDYFNTLKDKYAQIGKAIETNMSIIDQTTEEMSTEGKAYTNLQKLFDEAFANNLITTKIDISEFFTNGILTDIEGFQAAVATLQDTDLGEMATGYSTTITNATEKYTTAKDDIESYLYETESLWGLNQIWGTLTTSEFWNNLDKETQNFYKSIYQTQQDYLTKQNELILNSVQSEYDKLATLEAITKELEKQNRVVDTSYGIDKINNLKKQRELLAEEKEINAVLRDSAIKFEKTSNDTLVSALSGMKETYIKSALEAAGMDEQTVNDLLNKLISSDGVVNTSILDYILQFAPELADAIGADAEALKTAREATDKYTQAVYDSTDALYENAVAMSDYILEFNGSIDNLDLGYIEFQLSNISNKAFNAAENLELMEKKISALTQKSVTLQEAVGAFARAYISDWNLSWGLEKTFDAILTKSPQAISQIQKFGEELMSQMESIQSALQELPGLLSDYIKDISDAYGSINDKTSNFTQLASSYKNIAGLIGKSNSSVREALLGISKANLEGSQIALENAKREYEKYSTQLKAMEDEYGGPAGVLQSDFAEQYRELEALEAEAYNTMNANWESALQAAKDLYLQQTENILTEFERQIAGEFETIDALLERYNQTNTIDNQYVDDYKRVYELSKLTRKVEQDIEKSSTASSKAELRELQEELNKLQESGVELSAYDLENLQKKYELRKAEIALEEAQDAKRTVRLTRSADGNWGYVYTQNSEAVTEAAQNYEDKLFELQEHGQKYVDQVSENVLQIEKEFQDKVSSILNDENLSDAAKAARIKELQDFKTKQLKFYTSELSKVLNNNKSLYEDDVMAYTSATNSKLLATQDFMKSYSDTLLSQLTNTTTIEGVIDNFALASAAVVSGIIKAMEENQTTNDTILDEMGVSIGSFATDTSTNLDNAKSALQAFVEITQMDIPSDNAFRKFLQDLESDSENLTKQLETLQYQYEKYLEYMKSLRMKILEDGEIVLYREEVKNGKVTFVNLAGEEINIETGRTLKEEAIEIASKAAGEAIAKALGGAESGQEESVVEALLKKYGINNADLLKNLTTIWSNPKGKSSEVLIAELIAAIEDWLTNNKNMTIETITKVGDTATRLSAIEGASEAFGKYVQQLIQENDTETENAQIAKAVYDKYGIELDENTIQQFIHAAGEKEDNLIALVEAIKKWMEDNSSITVEVANNISSTSSSEVENTGDETITNTGSNPGPTEEEVKTFEEIATEALNAIKAYYNELPSKLQELVNSALTAAAEKIENAADAIAVANTAITNATNLVITNSNNAKELVKTASDALEQMSTAVQNAFTAAASQFVLQSSETTGLVRGALANITAVLSSIQSVLASLEGKNGNNNSNNNLYTLPYKTDNKDQKTAVAFDTGGYTGSWGVAGRMAMLHEKELVLNKQDTANILSAVDLVRTIASSIDISAAQAALGLQVHAASVRDNSSTLQQEITIHAEFPNATNRSEIEAAFETLANRATQYINR